MCLRSYECSLETKRKREESKGRSDNNNLNNNFNNNSNNNFNNNSNNNLNNNNYNNLINEDSTNILVNCIVKQLKSKGKGLVVELVGFDASCNEMTARLDEGKRALALTLGGLKVFHPIPLCSPFSILCKAFTDVGRASSHRGLALAWFWRACAFGPLTLRLHGCRCADRVSLQIVFEQVRARVSNKKGGSQGF